MNPRELSEALEIVIHQQQEMAHALGAISTVQRLRQLTEQQQRTWMAENEGWVSQQPQRFRERLVEYALLSDEQLLQLKHAFETEMWGGQQREGELRNSIAQWEDSLRRTENTLIQYVRSSMSTAGRSPQQQDGLPQNTPDQRERAILLSAVRMISPLSQAQIQARDQSQLAANLTQIASGNPQLAFLLQQLGQLPPEILEMLEVRLQSPPPAVDLTEAPRAQQQPIVFVDDNRETEDMDMDLSDSDLSNDDLDDDNLNEELGVFDVRPNRGGGTTDVLMFGTNAIRDTLITTLEVEYEERTRFLASENRSDLNVRPNGEEGERQRVLDLAWAINGLRNETLDPTQIINSLSLTRSNMIQELDLLLTQETQRPVTLDDLNLDDDLDREDALHMERRREQGYLLSLLRDLGQENDAGLLENLMQTQALERLGVDADGQLELPIDMDSELQEEIAEATREREEWDQPSKPEEMSAENWELIRVDEDIKLARPLHQAIQLWMPDEDLEWWRKIEQEVRANAQPKAGRSEQEEKNAQEEYQALRSFSRFVVRHQGAKDYRKLETRLEFQETLCAKLLEFKADSAFRSFSIGCAKSGLGYCFDRVRDAINDWDNEFNNHEARQLQNSPALLLEKAVNIFGVHPLKKIASIIAAGSEHNAESLEIYQALVVTLRESAAITTAPPGMHHRSAAKLVPSDVEDAEEIVKALAANKKDDAMKKLDNFVERAPHPRKGHVAEQLQNLKPLFRTRQEFLGEYGPWTSYVTEKYPSLVDAYTTMLQNRANEIEGRDWQEVDDFDEWDKEIKASKNAVLEAPAKAATLLIPAYQAVMRLVQERIGSQKDEYELDSLFLREIRKDPAVASLVNDGFKIFDSTWKLSPSFDIDDEIRQVELNLVKACGVSEIKIPDTASQEDARRAWMAAQLNGLPVTGYSPTDEDKVERTKRMVDLCEKLSEREIALRFPSKQGANLSSLGDQMVMKVDDRGNAWIGMKGKRSPELVKVKVPEGVTLKAGFSTPAGFSVGKKNNEKKIVQSF